MIIPIIRKIVPNLIASELCGVQPMTGPTGTIFNMSSKVGNIPCFNILQDYGDTVKITCNDEVHQWIKEQEISEWKFEYDVKNYYNAFLLSKELYIMLKLRWE